MPTTRIDKFEVMYSANTFVPRIWLSAAGKNVGQLIFYPNGKPLPVDTKRPDGTVDIFYHLDDFENVHQLLETEKQVFLLFNGSGGGFENGIMTSAEPVGSGIEVAIAVGTH
jgi:hypothetical protein